MSEHMDFIYKIKTKSFHSNDNYTPQTHYILEQNLLNELIVKTMLKANKNRHFHNWGSVQLPKIIWSNS